MEPNIREEGILTTGMSFQFTSDGGYIIAGEKKSFCKVNKNGMDYGIDNGIKHSRENLSEVLIQFKILQMGGILSLELQAISKLKILIFGS